MGVCTRLQICTAAYLRRVLNVELSNLVWKQARSVQSRTLNS